MVGENKMIKKIYPRFMPILPLVYDDTLSYYEQLCKFAVKLNELVDALNNFNENIEETVDEKISALKEYVDNENKKQDEITAEKFNQVYNFINNKVNEIYTYINNGDTILKNYIDKEILKLKDWVDDAVLGNIIIYDPTTGYKNPLEIVLSHIYDALRYWGINCYQFDSSNITCVYYDSKNMTALEFDTLSLEIIGKYYPHYIFNPVDGEYDTLQRVMYQWFQYHRDDAILINTFDGYEKTVETLDSYEFTAYSFDDNGNNIIVA